MRMMTDEEFKGKLAKVSAAAEIDKLIAEYSFTEEELAKIVGEFMGHKLEEGELEKLIGEAFEGQDVSPESIAILKEWLKAKK
ncbi:MAG: hypothetical protein IJS14_09145 [Lentisphaeria bacterium]|nr:hypothetical protein [Lentisphaeria bacterium]